MANAPSMEVKVDVRIDVSQGHTNPKTLPQWMYDQMPLDLLGYIITGYLAGVEVGRRVEKRNHVILGIDCPACGAPPGVWCTFREPGAPQEFAHQMRVDIALGDADAGRVPEAGGDRVA